MIRSQVNQRVPTQTIAITGANGYVGQLLSDWFTSAGYRVLGLQRAAKPTNGSQAAKVTGVKWVTGQADDPEALDALTATADFLVHLAFSHVPGRYRGGEADEPAEFWNKNLQMTERVLSACLRNKVKRCILLSSRAVFDGYPNAQRLTELAPPKPTTHYAGLKLAEEAMALRINQTSQLEVACIRSTGVFGLVYPRTLSKWYDAVPRWLNPQRTQPLDTKRRTEVHGNDLASAIDTILQSPEPLANLYHCSAIAVSEQELAALTRAISAEPTRTSGLDHPSTGVTVSPSHRRLLEENLDPSLPLRGPTLDCTRLLNLGWEPAGDAWLLPTIAALVHGKA